MHERRAAPSSPTIAVALGGGGARGIAHIAVLEALDELGLKPVAVAGCSMGAIIGAAYAAGLTGAELRAPSLALLRKRSDVMGRLLKARVGRFTQLFTSLSNPVLIDAEIFLDLFWPDAVPDSFEELRLPMTVVATDFAARKEAVFSAGPLAPAVAGSMAIPGLIRPVLAEGRYLIDGGVVNPLPYEHLRGAADCIIAVDVAQGPAGQKRATLSPFEAMSGSAQIMQAALTEQKIRLNPPDLLIRPAVTMFRALDFFRIVQILRAAESSKDEIKRGLEARLDVG